MWMILVTMPCIPLNKYLEQFVHVLYVLMKLTVMFYIDRKRILFNRDGEPLGLAHKPYFYT